MREGPWEEIAQFGKKIVSSGLTSSRFGNISILRDGRIFITATGSMLDELDSSTVIDVDLKQPCEDDKMASIETCVHRAIYLGTGNTAIIHTHSPYAVALSMLEADLNSLGASQAVSTYNRAASGFNDLLAAPLTGALARLLGVSPCELYE